MMIYVVIADMTLTDDDDVNGTNMFAFLFFSFYKIKAGLELQIVKGSHSNMHRGTHKAASNEISGMLIAHGVADYAVYLVRWQPFFFFSLYSFTFNCKVCCRYVRLNNRVGASVTLCIRSHCVQFINSFCLSHCHAKSQLIFISHRIDRL